MNTKWWGAAIVPLLLLGLNSAEMDCHSDGNLVRVQLEEAPVDLVKPLVDAANSRWFFFNSATRPFGMVNLSPDMGLGGAWGSGYRYNQDTIRAFSHIHAWQLSGVPVMPLSGDFTGHLGTEEYGSSFSHDREEVRPGYHQIFLDDHHINVELTATQRVGFHRYTFPAADESHILVDLSTHLGPCDTKSGMIRKVSDTEIEGYALMAATRRRPKDTYVYFVIQFDQPFEQFSTWQAGQILGESDAIEGARVGGWVSFPTAADEQRLMKVGVAYTSITQARKNLETELDHWNFEQVVGEARDEWNQWLSRIEVKGGTLEQRQRFYTDLWHALQGRRVISDVDGKYCDMTGSQPRIGQIPLDQNGKPLFRHYNSDSFWGAQWTIQTLWQLMYPRVAEEFVQSMLLMYQDGGLIPRGPSGGNYTFVMTGASSTPFIVAAYQKGLRHFDTDLAYEGLIRNHQPGGLMSKAGYEHQSLVGGGLEYYMDRGYIPWPLPGGGSGFHEDGAGQTMEYAYQDWCLAQFAGALGKKQDYDYYQQRSLNYRNLYNDSLGWMWVRNENGDWLQPADILKYGQGWVESNAAQTTWFVPHDLRGLADLMGGQKMMVEKLNFAFEQAQEHGFTASKAHDEESTLRNRRRYINYGNQPSMQTAFIFNHIGAPWLTQKWSRLVVDSVYTGISPQRGYNGDEDQGLMGSLAVLMKIGLFSMHGGASTSPYYEIASPVFDEISLHLDPDYYPGGTVTIRAHNQDANNFYINKASWNQSQLDQAWLRHDVLVEGGTLELWMDDSPNTEWGAADENLPPGWDD